MAAQATQRQAPRHHAAKPQPVGLRGLALVFIVGLALRLWPLTQYALWGSDTGEYLYLTERLTTTGAITFTYHGWGIAYPYFPGLYALAGSLHAVLGVPTLTAIKATGPLVGALAPVAIALIAQRVTRDGRAAIAAGLLAATAMPLAFVTSHTLPGTPGHLLALTAILLTIHGGDAHTRRATIAHALLLAPVAIALTVTHHLSLYFLVGAITGGALLRELGTRTPAHITARRADKGTRKTEASPRIHRPHWEAGVVAALVALASTWWLAVATPFRTDIVGDVLPIHPIALVALAYAALALLPAIVWWKRNAPNASGLRQRVAKWRLRPHAPGPRATLATGLAALGLLLLGALIVSRTSIPATAIEVSPLGVLYTLPLMLTVALAAPATRSILFHRQGALILGWGLAILASFALATIAQSHVLLPYRHVDYLVAPLAILAGAGYAHASDSLPPRPAAAPWMRRAAPAALALLVLAGAATAYPPASVMGGFEEGVTHAELDAVTWAATSLPPDAVVATDHRLSSALFGIAHRNATWDYAGEALHAPTWTTAKPHLEAVDAPSGTHRVTHVLVSPVMEEGVALYQWENARPLTPDALAKFEAPPFETLYAEEGVRIYRVNWTDAPGARV